MTEPGGTAGELDAERENVPTDILSEHFPATLAIIKARKKDALSLVRIVQEDAKKFGLGQRREVYEALAQVRRAEDEMIVIADRLRGWLDHPKGYRFVAVDSDDDGQCASHKPCELPHV